MRSGYIYRCLCYLLREARVLFFSVFWREHDIRNKSDHYLHKRIPVRWGPTADRSNDDNRLACGTFSFRMRAHRRPFLRWKCVGWVAATLRCYVCTLVLALISGNARETLRSARRSMGALAHSIRHMCGQLNAVSPSIFPLVGFVNGWVCSVFCLFRVCVCVFVFLQSENLNFLERSTIKPEHDVLLDVNPTLTLVRSRCVYRTVFGFLIKFLYRPQRGYAVLITN